VRRGGAPEAARPPLLEAVHNAAAAKHGRRHDAPCAVSAGVGRTGAREVGRGRGGRRDGDAGGSSHGRRGRRRRDASVVGHTSGRTEKNGARVGMGQRGSGRRNAGRGASERLGSWGSRARRPGPAATLGEALVPCTKCLECLFYHCDQLIPRGSNDPAFHCCALRAPLCVGMKFQNLSRERYSNINKEVSSELDGGLPSRKSRNKTGT